MVYQSVLGLMFLVVTVVHTFILILHFIHLVPLVS